MCSQLELKFLKLNILGFAISWQLENKQGRSPIQDNNNSIKYSALCTGHYALLTDGASFRGREDKGAFPPLCWILPPVGITKLMCKHTNLDCHPPKIFNTQFCPPPLTNFLDKALDREKWQLYPASYPSPPLVAAVLSVPLR